MNLIQQKLAEQISRLDDETLKEARKAHNPDSISSDKMGNNVNRKRTPRNREISN